VFVWINGRLRCLWRAVDQNGTVLDILIQWRRTATAATKFLPHARDGTALGAQGDRDR
jgi:putative transposase